MHLKHWAEKRGVMETLEGWGPHLYVSLGALTARRCLHHGVVEKSAKSLFIRGRTARRKISLPFQWNLPNIVWYFHSTTSGVCHLFPGPGIDSASLWLGRVGSFSKLLRRGVPNLFKPAPLDFWCSVVDGDPWCYGGCCLEDLLAKSPLEDLLAKSPTSSCQPFFFFFFFR